MPLTPGSLLGPYQILAPLGAGGMGEVYRARDTRLGREVAVKALPDAFAQDAAQLARFRREAQTLAALNHANIAAIYGLEEAGRVPYLVLELVEGESLHARLAKGAMPLREALPICVQIAAAIEAAHERGIIHRDLKPGNVMLSTSGIAKVLDFGLAKSDVDAAASDVDPTSSPTGSVYLGATEAGMILGTAAYMSPEQARGVAVDRRSDVWSFGCVVYECLTGRAAFRGDTIADLIARILEREPDWSALPTETPSRVRDLLRRCLRKDAGERPRDIRDVRLDLSEALTQGTKRSEQSIAVIPFNNLSGTEDEYFADGITDEILNALAHLDGLRVAARSSCFAFKGKHEDPRAVGERLDVASVLEGTVRRSGSRLRITVQLVNAADGYQLWSERYDREMTDVFEVQDEIAGAIAARLVGEMRGDADRARASRGTTSVEAYELFLKGRALQYQRGGGVITAIGLFEQALALDPGYAEALAWMADSYRLLGTYGMAPPSEVMPKAKAAVERALAIDPHLAEARATLADIELQYERDVARAEATWAMAIASDPRHSRARCERANWLAAAGRIPLTEAVEEMRRAAEADPLNSWVVGMHALLLSFVGRHAQEMVEAERAVRIDPGSFFAQWSLMRACSTNGDHERALAMAPGLLASSGRHVWALGSLAWTYGKLGNHDAARAVFDELEARSRHSFVSLFWMATAAASAGCFEEARALAERAVEERDPIVVLARFIVHWDEVREQPWFEETVQKLWS